VNIRQAIAAGGQICTLNEREKRARGSAAGSGKSSAAIIGEFMQQQMRFLENPRSMRMFPEVSHQQSAALRI
jgi:hypothetical protein